MASRPRRCNLDRTTPERKIRSTSEASEVGGDLLAPAHRQIRQRYRVHVQAGKNLINRAAMRGRVDRRATNECPDLEHAQMNTATIYNAGAGAMSISADKHTGTRRIKVTQRGG